MRGARRRRAGVSATAVAPAVTFVFSVPRGLGVGGIVAAMVYVRLYYTAGWRASNSRARGFVRGIIGDARTARMARVVGSRGRWLPGCPHGAPLTSSAMEASSAAWWRRASSRKSEIMALAAWFGMSDPCGRTAPVFGDLCENQNFTFCRVSRSAQKEETNCNQNYVDH